MYLCSVTLTTLWVSNSRGSVSFFKNVILDITNGRNVGSSLSKNTDKSQLRLVLLNAHIGSGVTFLGGPLARQPDVFYFNEPFHKVLEWRYLTGKKLCSYTKPDCQYMSDMRKRSLDYIEDLFNCKLQHHVDKFDDIFHTNTLLAGDSWKNFRNCRKYTSKTVLQCLHVMEDICKASTYRVVKVFRLNSVVVSSLLETLPNLKIIQIFRDPRSVINNHISAPWYPVPKMNLGRVKDDVRALCNRLNEDVTEAINIVKKNPDGFKVVQYEDIFNDVSKIKAVFVFTGLTVTSEIGQLIRTFVKRYSHRETQHNHHLVFKFRKTLHYSVVKAIEKHCKSAINVLGYKVFRSEIHMKDPRARSMVGKLPFAV
ncbi:sulfotransferase 5 [Mactra antiquata]